jgi:hypothetical protein
MILAEPLSFSLLGALVLALFLLSLIHALRRRHPLPRSLELLAFTLYGLGLESAAVGADLYDYGPFALKLGGAPLTIALGWGVIGVSAMALSDRLDLPQWGKPFLDAPLALLIDLGMDAVAVRSGMWDWGLALDEQWFGVPYDNFLAWWVVVFVMSSALRSGRYLATWYRRRWLEVGYPLLALALALPLFVWLLLTFKDVFGLGTLLPLLAASGFVLATTLRGVQRPIGPSGGRGTPAVWVPRAFHLFFLALLLSGPYRNATGVLLVALAAFALHEGALALMWRPQQPSTVAPKPR